MLEWKHINFDQLEKAYSKYSDEDNYPEAIKILEEGITHLPQKEIEDNYFTINTEKSLPFDTYQIY